MPESQLPDGASAGDGEQVGTSSKPAGDGPTIITDLDAPLPPLPASAGPVIALRSRRSMQRRMSIDPLTGSWVETWREGNGKSGYIWFDAIARQVEFTTCEPRVTVVERCRYFNRTDRCRITTWIVNPDSASTTIWETWLHGAQYDRYQSESEFSAALRNYLAAMDRVAQLAEQDVGLDEAEPGWLEALDPGEDMQGDAGSADDGQPGKSRLQ